jgi:hypothetical protein
VVALASAAGLVLALLTVFAIVLADTQAKSKRDVEARVHERAVLAAALIESLVATVRQQEAAYGVKFGGRAVSTKALNVARQQNAYVAVLDASGRAPTSTGV